MAAVLGAVPGSILFKASLKWLLQDLKKLLVHMKSRVFIYFCRKDWEKLLQMREAFLAKMAVFLLKMVSLTNDIMMIRFGCIRWSHENIISTTWIITSF